MGDVNQLPSVAMKLITNDSNFNYSCSTNTVRKSPFSNSWIDISTLKLLL